MSPSTDQNEITPHTKRLIRLIVSSPSSTDESFSQSLALLSNIASESSSRVLWDLIYILYYSLTREDWYPDDVTGLKGNDKSVSILVKKKNAALALERIARFIPIHDQQAFFSAEEVKSGDGLWLSIHDFAESSLESLGVLTPSGKDLLSLVLENGRLLLSSVGEEYDLRQYHMYQRENLSIIELESSINPSTSNEYIQELTLSRIKLQREILAVRLGLLSPVNTNGNIDDFITDNDLLNHSKPSREKSYGAKKSKIKETSNTKRRSTKRKKEEEDSETFIDEDKLFESPLRVLLQRALSSSIDSTELHCISNQPQNILATELLYQVFHPTWHVRFGALLGLLSLLRAWKRSCQSFQSFGKWPNDILARCVAILALDRFGDYAGAHFIPIDPSLGDGENYVHEEDLAPVREVAADVLSMLLMWAPINEVQYPCMKVLSRLILYKEWEVRHGAMRAFHFISLRHEGVHGIYNSCWKEIPTLAILGLTDKSDDLKGASAQVLSTIISLLLQRRQVNTPNLRDLIRSSSSPLWESVILLNDVASSTYYVLKLLAEVIVENSLLFLESLEEPCRLDMDRVFCKLAEFMFHSLSSVKVACLNAVSNIAGPIALLYSTRDVRVREKLLIAYCSVTENLFELIMTQGLYEVEDVSQVNTASELDNSESEIKILSQNTVLSIAINQAWRSMGKSFEFFFPVADAGCDKDLHGLISHLLMCLLSRVIGIHGHLSSNICRTYFSARKGEDCLWNIHSACVALSYFYCLPWCQQDDFCVLGSTLIALIQSPWLSTCETGYVFVSALSQNFSLLKTDDSATQFLQILWSNLALIVDAIPNSIKMNFVREKSVSEETQVLLSCREAFHKILKDILILGLLEDLNHSTSVFSKKIVQLWVDACVTETKKEETSDRKYSEIDTSDIAEMRVLASVACASVTLAPKFSLPRKLTPLVRSLMTSIKNEKNRKRRILSCGALTHLIKYLMTAVELPTALATKNKVIDSLCSLATEKPPTTEEGWVSARTIIQSLISDPLLADDMEQLKGIWCTIDSLHEKDTRYGDNQTRLKAIDLFSVISAFIPKSTSIFLHVVRLILPSITALGCSSVQSTESATARVSVANFCKIDPTKTIPIVIPTMWGYLNDPLNDVQRTAGALLLNRIVDHIGVFIAPFVRILLPMIMSLMMDSLESIAKVSAASFFSIVRIAPLSGSQEPISISGFERGTEAERVIDHLILGKKLPPYQLPDKIIKALNESNFILRPYQIEGISWLAFLRSVNLNAALCDDMGLGKTLQAIVSIAIAHSDSQSCDGNSASLVICPSSLTGYWINELLKILKRTTIQISLVGGSPKDRQMMWNKLSTTDVDCVFVTSYNILRTDVNQLEKHRWTYCVLDEGHLLKNAKSATAKASRRLRSKHKLILSGTPVQNHVQELWAIFDFLMPNYLGSDIEFSSRFGRDISRGQLPGASTENIQKGMYKLRQLHQQVLPFILRREKNQVLNELPPKTITLIPCELSSVQKQLYRHLSRTQDIQNALGNINRILETPIESSDNSNMQVTFNTDLRALHNLRLICTHPSLLADEDLIVKFSNDLRNIDCSGKLLALNDLLRTAQIVPSEVTGADNDESLLYINEGSSSSLQENTSELGFSDDFNKETLELPIENSSSNCRKCLIYAQFRQSLDVVEDFLFKHQMPSLKYLRIDGSVEPQKRTAIVQRFNEDDEIRCLLLTTKVGGLGLNLQAASIVIFLENDWNPHNDLQAMDRAHRLGQSKVVDIYHLVSSHTIEEKIMQVQDKKLQMSAAIVNTENSSMFSMGTESILDLF